MTRWAKALARCGQSASPQAAWALFGLVAGACTHYVTRGGDLYDQGRYVEAAHVLEKSEARLQSADLQERAQYGLYRGATLRRLGDFGAAERWLRMARQLSKREPKLLGSEEQRLLEESWLALQADLDRRALPRAR